jgi:hypothetical protein
VVSFTSGERASVPIGYAGWAPEPVCAVSRSNNSWLYRELNSDSSVVQSVSSHYTDCAIRLPLGRYPHRRTGVSFTSQIFQCTLFAETRGVNETPVLRCGCGPMWPWMRSLTIERHVKTSRRVEHAVPPSPHTIFVHCLQLYCHVSWICSRDLFLFKILKQWIIQTFYRIPLARQRPNARPVPALGERRTHAERHTAMREPNSNKISTCSSNSLPSLRVISTWRRSLGPRFVKHEMSSSAQAVRFWFWIHLQAWMFAFSCLLCTGSDLDADWSPAYGQIVIIIIIIIIIITVTWWKNYL